MRKLQGDRAPAEQCHITLGEASPLLPTPDGKRSVALFEHTKDEIYVIASGAGWFVNGDARHRFAPHDVLFVPAGIVHRFEEFTDDFQAWVFFYGPEGGESDGA